MKSLKKLIPMLVLAAISCSDPTQPPVGRVAEVDVTGPSPHLWVGQTLQLTATALDAHGNEVEGWTVSWSSRNAIVARVSTGGQVKGLTEGTAVVVATAGGRSGQIELDVFPEPVARVTVDPSGSVTMEAGETLHLRATAFGSADDELDERIVHWSSEADAVATVDTAGLVLGRSGGTTTITANIEGVSADVEVTVTAAATPVATVTVSPPELLLAVGGTGSLQARTFAADGLELIGRTVTWTSSAGAIVSVDVDGTLHAHDDGVAWITASSGGASAEAKVTVTAWRSSTLATVGGDPLPFVWRTFPYTDAAGVELTRTIKVVAGGLWVDVGAARYEQELTLELWEQTYALVDGVPVFWGVRLVETKVFEDLGTAEPLFEGAGTLVFRSEVIPVQTFSGFASERGWEVTERINGSGDPLVLVFLGR